MPDGKPPTVRVPYVNLGAQFAEERDKLMPAIEAVLSRGELIGGPLVEEVERRLQPVCGTSEVIALNSGTDALIFAMLAAGIGRGDEVITPPNSFVASTASIVHVGATPVFADVLPDQNIDPAAIERAITPRTKAIMPVHLSGRVADMNPIMAIADKHGLIVIEDAAQSIGSRYDNRMSGSFGLVSCFSGHPLKNLNAGGDAGFVGTSDPKIAERVRRLRNHGLIDRNTVAEWGFVSRLDAMQAAILLVRLDSLPSVIERRRRNAALYQSLLDPKHVFFPPCRPVELNTFHTFVIQVDRRDALKDHLAREGIGSAIHYPVPIHLQPAAASLGKGLGSFPVTERQAERILTLPVHQFLSEADIRTVAATVNAFYQS